MNKRQGVFSNLDSSPVAQQTLKLSHVPEEAESWQEGLTGESDKGSTESAPKSSRLYLVFAFLGLIILVLLTAQLFNLQVVLGSRNRELAEGNRIRSREIFADRGAIFDINGEILAKNKPSYDVAATPFDLPKDKKGRQALFAKLGEILKISSAEIEKKIEGGKPLSNLEPVIFAESVAREISFEIEAKKDQLPGISVQKKAIRDYPGGEVFAHLLGYTAKISEEEYRLSKADYVPNDLIGKTGVEKEYEKVLRGVLGREQIEVDSNGNLSRVLASVDPEPGQSVKLSIDAGLQRVLASALAKSIESSGGKGGAAVALDPRSGAVRALVSLPSYDNNLFAQGISNEEYKSLTEDPAHPLFFRPLSGEYPPGSTAKIIAASGALQDGVITADTTLSCPGILKIVNPYNPDIVYTFPDWKLSGFGSLSVREALAYSSDVFFYQVGGGFEDFAGMGLNKLEKWQKKFGLGVLTGIDLPGEVSGLVPDEKWKKRVVGEDWYVGDTYHMTIGQGYLSATPLQMASATATIANGGTLFVPEVMEETLDSSGKTVAKTKPRVARQNIADASVLQIVREGMRGSVQYGTSSWIKDWPVAVAGKTGTAEFAGSTTGHEHAWFTSFAPYDNPELVITVLVEAGGEGTIAAAPVADEGYKYWFGR